MAITSARRGPCARWAFDGSATAGIIAAADGDEGGIAGVAPEAEIVHVKVLRDRTGSGPSAACMAGLYYAADIGADVVNMSFGWYLLRNYWNAVALFGLGRAAVPALGEAEHAVRKTRVLP